MSRRSEPCAHVEIANGSLCASAIGWFSRKQSRQPRSALSHAATVARRSAESSLRLASLFRRSDLGDRDRVAGQISAHRDAIAGEFLETGEVLILDHQRLALVDEHVLRAFHHAHLGALLVGALLTVF